MKKPRQLLQGVKKRIRDGGWTWGTYYNEDGGAKCMNALLFTEEWELFRRQPLDDDMRDHYDADNWQVRTPSGIEVQRALCQAIEEIAPEAIRRYNSDHGIQWPGHAVAEPGTLHEMIITFNDERDLKTGNGTMTVDRMVEVCDKADAILFQSEVVEAAGQTTIDQLLPS